jgi:hypothetical protein
MSSAFASSSDRPVFATMVSTARATRRLGEARADGVDCDSDLGEFERQRACEANEAVLAAQ